MPKPATAAGYRPEVTELCERVLVTLLRGLGPWKESVYLIGGLTPRYLTTSPTADGSQHAGTADVDVVVELEMLAQTDAYYTLEDNLRRMGFRRATDPQGEKRSWQWRAETEVGAVLLELLADDPQAPGGHAQPLPTQGTISAINIPHASMVLDHHDTKEIRAALLDGGGIAVEIVRHADIVSFVCLKALAFDQRNEPKDAYDLAFCLRHAAGGLEAVTEAFQSARQGHHAAVIDRALDILSTRFADDPQTEGYRKDGPVAVARFEIEYADREVRLLRQRDIAHLFTSWLAQLGR